MDNDLLTLILEILLMICLIGLCFGVYIWYLDWLWYKSIRKAQRTIYRPVGPIETVSYREIADK